MKLLPLAAFALGAFLVMGGNDAQASHKLHMHLSHHHCHYGHYGYYDAKADVWRDTCYMHRHHDGKMMMRLVDPMKDDQPAMYHLKLGGHTHPHNSGIHIEN